MSFSDKIRKAWNIFRNREPTEDFKMTSGFSYPIKPDRPMYRRGAEKSIISAIYTRIAVDVSALTFHHVILNENGMISKIVKDCFEDCLQTAANKDQSAKMFIRDIVESCLDEGVIAVLPVDTTVSPLHTDSYDIGSLRTAKILEWFPDAIRVRAYNDEDGSKKDVIVPKHCAAIIENPFYSMMNEPNSTLKRLQRKLAILDAVDEQSGSSKLDLILQLPYAIKTDAQRRQAEQRKKDIEEQLRESKYGIAYTDGTEKVIQLNRSLENNLLTQVEYLTRMLHSQLGITQEILDGTANESIMSNYYSRTIEPFADAIVDAFKIAFLSKTARTLGHAVVYYRDPFKLVPVNLIADIADKLTRNEIVSSNEIRTKIGFLPVASEAANELSNKNINQSTDRETAVVET